MTLFRWHYRDLWHRHDTLLRKIPGTVRMCWEISI